MVNRGPYSLAHSCNWIQGRDLGRLYLLPMKGSGFGPGGRRDQVRMSDRRAKMGRRDSREIGRRYCQPSYARESRIIVVVGRFGC